MLIKKEAKRLGVFIFYDKEGIVDDYVLTLLKSLKEAVADIIIVSNCSLQEEEKKKFEKFTDKIKIRKNIGLDAGAFKDTFMEYQEYFKTFDELILMNDTFYGPFIPFKTIFEDMAKKDIDFWGLTANYQSPDGFGYLPNHVIPSHIQTFFLALRKNVLESDAFNTYWMNYNIKKMNSFEKVVTKHEIYFTQFLEQAGFKWDIYTDLERYHSQNIEENYNYYAYASYDLIKNCQCPFIKRKNFVFEKSDALYLSDGEDNKKSLEYIKNHTEYDVNNIYKNLTRLYKPSELYYGLNLNYIVEEKKESSKSMAILLFLEEEKYIENYIHFLKSTDIKPIYVFTNKKKIFEKLSNENIKVTKKDEFKKEAYSYYCILKDKNYINSKINLVYETNFQSILKNALNSMEYLNGIYAIFEENPYLKMLVLPQNLHSDYFGAMADTNRFILANDNCFFIKKELLDWNAILNENFIVNWILNGKGLVGKVYNKNAVNTLLINQEYALQKTYKILGNCNGHMKHLSGLLYVQKHRKHLYMNPTFKIRLYRLYKKIMYKWF